MKTYFFTFGSNRCENGYVVIDAQSYGSARDEMFRRYGMRWSFQYNEDQWKGQSEKYGLFLVAHIYVHLPENEE